MPESSPNEQPAPLAYLVTRAAAGDQDAWAQLVTRYTPLLWAIATTYVDHHTAADTIAHTWAQAVAHIHTIRNPDKIGAWLATTCRHQALTTLAQQRREQPQDHTQWDHPTDHTDPADGLIRAEDAQRLHAALRQLPPRQQELLRTLTTDPPPSYEEVAQTLGMPHGSIGPIRQRALKRLRKLLASEYAEN